MKGLLNKGMTVLRSLEDRLLHLEFLTLPEQINPNKLLVIDNPSDSIIGGLEQTQATLRNLGQEQPELQGFLSKCKKTFAADSRSDHRLLIQLCR